MALWLEIFLRNTYVGIEAYVKYNYFHKEQKRKMKNDPFLVQNLFYNKEQDFFVCPMGQRMVCVGNGTRKSAAGYQSNVSYYQAKNCEGYQLSAMCHKSKGNRRIEVNHRLNELKYQARELLTSEKGLEHKSKRPVEVEAVFGQLKHNNKFSRFALKGLAKVEIEFLLMALGHNLRKWAKKIVNIMHNPTQTPPNSTVIYSFLHIEHQKLKNELYQTQNFQFYSYSQKLVT